jgi:hypothetical protein
MADGKINLARRPPRTWYHRVGIRLTASARRMLHAVEFRNDHGPSCTCMSCVIARAEARSGG